MTTAIVPSNDVGSTIEQVLISGDLSKLTAEERVRYYNAVCQSVGLNPLTKPFGYLTLNNKLTLYALRDCTDQLRKIHGVSITITSREKIDDVYVVTARAVDKTGRSDESTGVVSLGNVKGDNLANALMKAETKAKRRVTLSICGLGMLDETETETVTGAHPVASGGVLGGAVDLNDPQSEVYNKTLQGDRRKFLAAAKQLGWDDKDADLWLYKRASATWDKVPRDEFQRILKEMADGEARLDQFSTLPKPATVVETPAAAAKVAEAVQKAAEVFDAKPALMVDATQEAKLRELATKLRWDSNRWKRFLAEEYATDSGKKLTYSQATEAIGKMEQLLG